MSPRDIRIVPLERDLIERRQRSLPHWEHPSGTYFVTFRLDDSLPAEVRNAYREEQKHLSERWEKAQGLERQELEREMARLYCRRIDRCLDVGLGACHLAHPTPAMIVARALQHFDRQRYDLFAWSILPNHVHVVFRPLADHSLEKILHSWKSFSAGQVNEFLGRRGPLWQREYFDHLVRSQRDLDRFVRYVATNAAKAGIPDSPWQWVCEELRSPSSEASG
ncbi:MAG: transposase [Fimbriimonas sp.]